MYNIDEILVDETITTSYFSCDLEKCKGACCTFPGKYGAPLKDEEIPEIEKCLEAAKEYMPKRAIQVLKKEGFSKGRPGKQNTVCIDDKDCVFVYYQGNIALCALERAFIDGKTKFRKPISCHLFPIRVGDFAGKYIYYEKIDECRPAINKGKAEQAILPCYVENALVRAFGEDWTEKLILISNDKENNL